MKKQILFTLTAFLSLNLHALTIDKSSVDLGDMNIGVPFSEKRLISFVVNNNEAVSADSLNLALTQAAESDQDKMFKVLRNTCTGSLAAGASCSVLIKAQPVIEGDFENPSYLSPEGLLSASFSIASTQGILPFTISANINNIVDLQKAYPIDVKRDEDLDQKYSVSLKDEAQGRVEVICPAKSGDSTGEAYCLGLGEIFQSCQQDLVLNSYGQSNCGVTLQVVPKDSDKLYEIKVSHKLTDNFPISCLEIKNLGLGSTDGYYSIDPNQDGVAVKVHCDMTNGGWTEYLHIKDDVTAAQFNENNNLMNSGYMNAADYALLRARSKGFRFTVDRIGHSNQYFATVDNINAANCDKMNTPMGTPVGDSFYIGWGEGNVEGTCSGSGSDYALAILKTDTKNFRLYKHNSHTSPIWKRDSFTGTEGQYTDAEMNVPYTKVSLALLEEYPKYPKSCKEVLERRPNLLNKDGAYLIDPDGANNGIDPLYVYCDMTTDGGGWTRVVSVNHGATLWSAFDTANNFPENALAENSNFGMPINLFSENGNGKDLYLMMKADGITRPYAYTGVHLGITFNNSLGQGNYQQDSFTIRNVINGAESGCGTDLSKANNYWNWTVTGTSSTGCGGYNGNGFIVHGNSVTNPEGYLELYGAGWSSSTAGNIEFYVK